MRKNFICNATFMIALALLASAGFPVAAGAVPPVGGCDYPLFIQSGAVDANILLLFDNSGSMNEVIRHDAFDETQSFTGGFTQTTSYSVGSTGTYTFNGVSATLVASDGGQSGRYSGKYLNWIFWHASSAERAAIPTVTRIQVAKPAVNQIINANPNIRFGAWKFNFEDYGTEVAAVGTAHATIMSRIDAIVGDAWTPIGETMETIYRDIYEDPIGNANTFQYECQKTFLVIVTDGEPTKEDKFPYPWALDNDGDGYHPDDIAGYFRSFDFSATLDGVQNVATYTIGFNVDANVLQDTADRGDGLYISANNPAQLTASLDAVLRDIINRISSGSAVAVVSTEGNSQDLLFRGKFKPGEWKGFLEAFTLPYDPVNLPVWEAGALLESRSAASRQIYTTVGGARIDFVDSYAGALRAALGAASDLEAEDLINWTRGDLIAGLRDRAGWKLGDVIESSPLVVGPPRGFILHDDYLSWRQIHQNRERVIYIGANDGMVHCFRESDGYELWAWIPEAAHADLAAIADVDYCHRFTCNLTPRVFDAYVGGSWKTMLIAGQKQGGNAYLALDVTDPNSPLFMWETELPDINGSWSMPEVARVESLNKTVVFVGTGPDELTGRARLKAIDLETGSQEYDHLLSDNAGTKLNMATGARALDLNFDGWHDLLYISDLEGNVYRADLTQSPFVVDRLFQADANQEIQAQPIVTVDFNDDVFLYFGTGQYLMASDLADTDQQTFYSVIDKHDGFGVTRADMVDETSTISPVGPNDRGWYIDLVQRTGERIVEPDALVAGIVYFTSFAPSTNACSAGGFSWLYSVDFRNGSGDDGDDDESNDTIDDRVQDIGDGIATKPVVDVVNEEVIVQGSDTRIHVNDAKGLIQLLSVRAWRQRYE